ncbi:hypothetical protein ACFE04_025277 [Oxalis oulophora]
MDVNVLLKLDMGSFILFSGVAMNYRHRISIIVCSFPILPLAGIVCAGQDVPFIRNVPWLVRRFTQDYVWLTGQENLNEVALCETLLISASQALNELIAQSFSWSVHLLVSSGSNEEMLEFINFLRSHNKIGKHEKCDCHQIPNKLLLFLKREKNKWRTTSYWCCFMRASICEKTSLRISEASYFDKTLSLIKEFDKIEETTSRRILEH